MGGMIAWLAAAAEPRLAVAAPVLGVQVWNPLGRSGGCSAVAASAEERLCKRLPGGRSRMPPERRCVSPGWPSQSFGWALTHEAFQVGGQASGGPCEQLQHMQRLWDIVSVAHFCERPCVTELHESDPGRARKKEC
jgi:hypothetical protein